MKIRKFILSATSLLSVGAFAAVSCTGGGSAKQEEIVVAVDGVQRAFYEKAIEAYNKTESAKKYKIRTIEKDVWGALDFSLQGITSPEVADIFYLPGDRVTDLTQQNALSYIDEFIPSLIDELSASTGATAAEKELLRAFGTIRTRVKNGQNITNVTKLMAIRHNTEAILMASRLPEADARRDLSNANTDTLVELVKEGKLLLRFQDFWYGNGVLAGALEKIKTQNSLDSKLNLMSRILYTDETRGQITSGFIDGNQYNAYFKEALKVYSSLFFPIYEAAFLKSESDFGQTVWGKKGISQSDLRQTLVKEVGEAQATIFSLMNQGKIDYAVIGSWDTQNSEKSAGAQSFFNVVKTDDNTEYLQSPGSWSFAINSRNNSASEERKTAIKEWFKAIYSVAAYKEYFKNDSKVPFVNGIQKTLIDDIKAENSAQFTEVEQFAKDLGFASYDALKTERNSKTAKISVLANQKVWGNTWSADNDQTSPSAEANLLKAADHKASIEKPEVLTDADFNAITLGDILPLRNLVASLLSISDVKTLVGVQNSDNPGNQEWLVGKDLLKDGSFNIPQAETLKHGDSSLHMRKVEKEIFDVNGDSEDEKEKIIKTLTEALTKDKTNNDTAELDKLVEKYLNKAKSFVYNFAKSSLDDAKVKEFVTLYLNTYLNPARVRLSVGDIFNNKKFIEGKDATYKQVDEKVSGYESKLTFNKLLNVISSTQAISEGGLGVLKTQLTRADNSNPQFTTVWGFMNDRTFGNAELYREFANKNIDTLDKFTNEMAKTLSKVFDEQAGKLNASNSDTYVTISN